MTQQPEIVQLIDHLFRHEAGKMVSVLTRIFGAQNLDLAEDVVQDSLIEAMSQWQYKEVPGNPSAEIYYSLEIQKMKEIDKWLNQFRKIWETRYDQLDKVLSNLSAARQAIKKQKKC